MPLQKFVLWLNSMTTTEICEQFNIPIPVYTGDVQSSAKQFLQIDAILWRMVKDRAQFESKVSDVTEEKILEILDKYSQYRSSSLLKEKLTKELYNLMNQKESKGERRSELINFAATLNGHRVKEEITMNEIDEYLKQ